MTPDQTRANAEKLYPSHHRPTCPILARAWDQRKNHYIAARLQIEQQRAQFLNWSATYAAENNLDLQTIVLNGHARRAYAQWQDNLRPPNLTTQDEILAAAEDIYGNLSTEPDDQYYVTRNRAAFIQQAQHRLQNYELALAIEETRQGRARCRTSSRAQNELTPIQQHPAVQSTCAPRASVMECGAEAPLSALADLDADSEFTTQNSQLKIL